MACPARSGQWWRRFLTRAQTPSAPRKFLRHSLRLEALEPLLLPSVFQVTTTADSGPGSLRQAIQSANSTGGTSTIDFNIAGSGVHQIRPASALPSLLAASLTIDGTSQPGYAGVPLIQIDGTLSGSNANGLVLAANGITVKGLDITRFSSNGILVLGTSYNWIERDYIGVDPTGTIAQGNAQEGVLLNTG